MKIVALIPSDLSLVSSNFVTTQNVEKPGFSVCTDMIYWSCCNYIDVKHKMQKWK